MAHLPDEYITFTKIFARLILKFGRNYVYKEYIIFTKSHQKIQFKIRWDNHLKF